jgi:hypothetical protein
MRKKIILLSAMLTLVVSLAFAASLSDLNMKAFQNRTAPTTTASENPFLKKNLSPSDLMVEDLTLTGIVYRPDEAFALVSGYIVKEGEDIAGYRVKLIEADHIVLKQLDQIKILRLE